MSARVGEVELAGTLAGPESAWPVSEAGLAHALEEAGMPPGALRLVRDGGWLTVEPAQAVLPMPSFRADPGAALGEAVRKLSGGRPLPEDWGSTLRAVEYQEGRKVETVVGLADDGVHAVSRVVPWQPVPDAGVAQLVRRYWLVGLLLAVALGGMAWLNRADLMASLKTPVDAGASEDAASEQP